MWTFVTGLERMHAWWRLQYEGLMRNIRISALVHYLLYSCAAAKACPAEIE